MAIKRGEPVNLGSADLVFGVLLLAIGVGLLWMNSSNRGELDRLPAWTSSAGTQQMQRNNDGWMVFGIVSGIAGGAVLARGLSKRSNATEQPAKDRRPCPFCAEQIHVTAIKCRFCGSDVKPLGLRVEDPQTPAPPPEVCGSGEEHSVLRENIQQLKGRLQAAGEPYGPEMLWELGSQYALLYDATGALEHRRSALKYMAASREAEAESDFSLRQSAAFGSLMNDPEFADFVS